MTKSWAVLKRFLEMHDEIQQFMASKGKVVNELSSVQWLADLAFLVDLTQQLIYLNLLLQGSNKLYLFQLVGNRWFQVSGLLEKQT